MSVLDFFENHGTNRVRLTTPFSYELDGVGSAYSALIRARHERDFTDKKGLPRVESQRLARDHRVDRACDALRAAVARMARTHPQLAAICYRELLADEEAEYKALLARATTHYGRRAIADTRRAFARAAHSISIEGTRP